ncbi:hypothetical protein [Cryobacterium sp. TMT4-31]|uniref:hypothetical protein n=1 Tax=Cryobacterium sp. TMT4-31 TaxID=1259259 RepID=UPI00106C807C|nr:hypothetical protein [Cryobacterium sp. TMT4-31]TFC87455.1 hypothetical protein E3T19_12535 [Cryobacterium sp. TMT4-31]
MNAATCAILAGVFPLILIAIVADRRGIHQGLKRRSWYRRSFVGTVAACLLGIVYAVIGVQVEGFKGPEASLLWILFTVALLAFAASIVLSIATQENAEDQFETEAERTSQMPALAEAP